MKYEYSVLKETSSTGSGNSPPAGGDLTIGLILCTEKNEAVAKYSVLNDRKQIFASKYMTCLPTEEQLVNEIKREIRLIENVREDGDEIGGGI